MVKLIEGIGILRIFTKAPFCKANNHFENQIISSTISYIYDFFTYLSLRNAEHIGAFCSDSNKLENKGRITESITVSSSYP